MGLVANGWGLGMDSKDQHKEFLAKAKEAREQADLSRDRHEKESWIRIAHSYLELASRRVEP